MFSLKKVEYEIMPRIMKKATQSPNNFFVAAAAFSKSSVCYKQKQLQIKQKVTPSTFCLHYSRKSSIYILYVNVR